MLSLHNNHPAPRVIVFDIGGVFIDWDPEYLYSTLIPDAAEREFFLTHVCPRIWNAHQDLGLHSWAQAVEARIKIYPQYAALIHAYNNRWADMVKGAIVETVQIKNDLRQAGIPLYAITNFSVEKWALAQTLWPFLSDFDGVIVSGAEKLLKPDPAIYRLLCQRYGLNAQDCLFIDDVPANIDAAKSVGMMGHVFTSAALLRDTLENQWGLKLAA